MEHRLHRKRSIFASRPPMNPPPLRSLSRKQGLLGSQKTRVSARVSAGVRRRPGGNKMSVNPVSIVPSKDIAPEEFAALGGRGLGRRSGLLASTNAFRDWKDGNVHSVSDCIGWTFLALRSFWHGPTGGALQGETHGSPSVRQTAAVCYKCRQSEPRQNLCSDDYDGQNNQE